MQCNDTPIFYLQRTIVSVFISEARVHKILGRGGRLNTQVHIEDYSRSLSAELMLPFYFTNQRENRRVKSCNVTPIPLFCPLQKTMRMDALIVFRSILKRQPARFRDYAELTILKICEAHKDPSKDVRLDSTFSIFTLGLKLFHTFFFP